MDLKSLRELLWSFAGHRVVTVAARTGILRRLARSSASPDQVASELGLDPLATGKMVRALHALGVLAVDGSDYVVVDPLRRHFVEGPDDLTPYVEHSHYLYERWGDTLEPWVRGESWPHRARSAAEVAAFAKAMEASGRQLAKLVVAAVEVGDARRMLDIGGSVGHYARTFCAAHPRLEATVLDRPEVAALGREAVAGTPLASRLHFVGGDYHETSCGGGFDLVLLANVIHQERPEGAARLIERVATETAIGGRVLVVDFAIDPDQRTHRQGALFAINMRSFGDTYSEPTIRRWMEAASLGEVERHDLDENRWLIVGTRRA